MSESGRPIERYDMLIVSQARDFNLVDQGVKSLINFLATANIMRPSDEAIAAEWVEVYGGPGPTAHEAFTRGAFDSDLQPFIECAVRGGQTYVPLPYGGEKGEKVRFFLEFRGCLWKDLGPKVKNRLGRLLMTRFDIYTRPHAELPPHAEVGEDELPEDRKFARKDRVSMRVGTAVEEF